MVFRIQLISASSESPFDYMTFEIRVKFQYRYVSLLPEDQITGESLRALRVGRSHGESARNAVSRVAREVGKIALRGGESSGRCQDFDELRSVRRSKDKREGIAFAGDSHDRAGVERSRRAGIAVGPYEPRLPCDIDMVDFDPGSLIDRHKDRQRFACPVDAPYTPIRAHRDP